MENNPSKKKFRGFKYMVLALLIFAAFGLAWFSAGGSQSGDRQAAMEEKVSSFVADAKEQGKSLMDNAVDNKAGAGEGIEWTEGATSTIGSGETEMEDTGTSADMSEQAISGLGEDKSEVSAMTGDTTGSGMEESSGVWIGTPSMSFKEHTSMSFRSTRSPSFTMSDASEAETMKSGMDQSKSSRMSDMASSEVQQQRDESNAKKSNTSGASAIRCVGTPAKGKDLGDHYIVAVCETMSIISERTGVGVEDLKNRNPQVDNPDLIFPNQRLWLPPRG